MRKIGIWGIAVGLWLGLALSLGWYYTFTYYGRTGIPIPTPETCASLVLYYFSVLNVDTEIQALHWLIVFPLAGVLWTLSLAQTAPLFNAPRPACASLALGLALCSLPLVLPAPAMTLIAGWTDAGFSRDRMLAVALRHGWVNPWPGLNPTYIALGLLTATLQVWTYRRTFPLRGRKAWLHAATSLATLILAVSLVGAIAAIPLRTWLE